ncbi:hypothetical protein [Streptomyces sp. BPTC-684]|uniref:hypothetical protein n=1 Tax=Streptomyces sp. BPTC-684 TaxID=3043734 RepID=UPI0024B060E8|nr:hypothetical protein [Streptomyces sp. BPTC-684]WHM37424.1 hypothetical protein QIY60_11255 [Streptomyces sp. BPTC-684]
MSEPAGTEQLATSQREIGSTSEAAFREKHAARARRALDRAAAACAYAGIEERDARAVPREPAEKVANALRLSAQVLGELAHSPLDPAADARCARNAAAAAAVAAQIARDHGGATELSVAAYRAALKASQSAMQAAGSEGMGRNEALNAKADTAEADAFLAAKAAGWL